MKKNHSSHETIFARSLAQIAPLQKALSLLRFRWVSFSSFIVQGVKKSLSLIARHHLLE